MMEAMIPPQKLLKVSVRAVTTNDEATAGSAARHVARPRAVFSLPLQRCYEGRRPVLHQEARRGRCSAPIFRA